MIITGDVIYGEFDDSGRSLELFCDFMDSLGVPWAPVYGNHDNETLRGVDWQNNRLESAPLCLFRKGSVTGNGNYSILLTCNGIPCRALYMLDSGGCMGSRSESARRGPGFAADQYDWLYATAEAMNAAAGETVPSFVGFHIPTVQFHQAAVSKGYQTADEHEKYVIGVTSPARDGDFGCKREPIGCFGTPEDFVDRLHKAGIDGVFAGHCHANNTSVLWKGIRWTYGLKTGQYDYHTAGQLGGTLITLWEKNFTVVHVPSLAPMAKAPNPPRH
jgi:3',5'-cyclic AMP phosphodiesterase CpdA